MDHQMSNTTEMGDADDRPSNVLLRTPEDGPEPMPCPAGDARRLLVVSLDGDANDRLAARRTRSGLPPVVAVLVAGETRSATAAAAGAGPTTGNGGTRISWATVEGPGDLAAIGEKIDACLSSWADEADGMEICFDSVSAVLTAVDRAAAYRFLHILMRRIEAAGVVAHYHLGEAAEDPQLTSTIETLFEHVREYDAGTGSWVEG